VLTALLADLKKKRQRKANGKKGMDLVQSMVISRAELDKKVI